MQCLNVKAHFVQHCNARILPITQPYPHSLLHVLLLQVPPEKQRFWKWAARQNNTYRPAQVLRLEPGEDPPISVS